MGERRTRVLTVAVRFGRPFLTDMAKRSNTSAHNRSHQHHRNGIKRARNVPLWFPQGMNKKFLLNAKYAKAGLNKKDDEE